MTLQFLCQGFATEIRHIKRIHTHTNDLALLFLNRETRVEEKDRVAFLVQLGDEHIDGESRLHATYGRNDALGRDIEVHEGTNELATPVFDLGDTRNERILGAIARLEGFVLGCYTDLLGR